MQCAVLWVVCVCGGALRVDERAGSTQTGAGRARAAPVCFSQCWGSSTCIAIATFAIMLPEELDRALLACLNVGCLKGACRRGLELNESGKACSRKMHLC